MQAEAELWMRQANADLEAARDSIKNRHYEWACFAAQQSVEKALKALHIFTFHKAPPKTHFLEDLIMPFKPSDELIVLAMEISEDYTLARYPDVADVIPFEMYTREIAQRRIKGAQKILLWVLKQMGRK